MQSRTHQHEPCYHMTIIVEINVMLYECCLVFPKGRITNYLTQFENTYLLERIIVFYYYRIWCKTWVPNLFKTTSHCPIDDSEMSQFTIANHEK